jgi:hypothetical protein
VLQQLFILFLKLLHTVKVKPIILFCVFFLLSISSLKSYNNAVHNWLLKNQLSQNDSKEVIEKFNSMLNTLNHNGIYRVNPTFWKNTRVETLEFPEYASLELKPLIVGLHQLHFMQASCWDLFCNDTYDVITTAIAIREGKLNFNTLHKIRVWQDIEGRIWTLDHRRVVAMILSGVVEYVPVIWTEREYVTKHRFEFTNKWQGKRIYVYLDDELAMLVKIPDSYMDYFRAPILY